MRFLITRPRRDAEQMADRLHALGHETVISPVMEVACQEPSPPPADTLDGVIITSRNALTCLQQKSLLGPLTPLPLFAVGEASATLARQYGFAQVVEGPGRAEQLLTVIPDHFNRKAACLYHPGGRQKAFDLAPGLAQHNIELIEQMAYEGIAADSFSSEALNLLQTGGVDAVILLSPRSASIFETLIHKFQIDINKKPILALCISKNVANNLKMLEESRITVAPEPNIDGIFTLIWQIMVKS